MTVPPINLAKLREAASDPKGFSWHRCGPQVLALIDIAEAAHAFEHAYQRSLASASAYDHKQRDLAQAELRVALNRLDFSESG